MIDPNDTVLDVGGQLNQLAKFCRAKKVTVANLKGSLEKSDVKIEKGKLPFKTGYFSTVCAIDVLEHIERNSRQAFVKELLRVSSSKIILSFPIGTKQHVQYEKEMADWLKAKGQDLTYLKEHSSLGLPTPEEVQSFIKGRRGEISYSGNLNVNRLLFKIYMSSPRGKIGKVVYFAKLIFHLFTNRILYVMLSKKEFSKDVVRAYVVIHK